MAAIGQHRHLLPRRDILDPNMRVYGVIVSGHRLMYYQGPRGSVVEDSGLLLQAVGVGVESFVVLVWGLEVEGYLFADFVGDVDAVNFGIDLKSLSIHISLKLGEIKNRISLISIQSKHNRLCPLSKMNSLNSGIFLRSFSSRPKNICSRFLTISLVGFIVVVINEERLYCAV